MQINPLSLPEPTRSLGHDIESFVATNANTAKVQRAAAAAAAATATIII